MTTEVLLRMVATNAGYGRLPCATVTESANECCSRMPTTDADHGSGLRKVATDTATDQLLAGKATNDGNAGEQGDEADER
jgi:hypothetical protein